MSGELPGWMQRAASEVRRWITRVFSEISVVGLASTHGPIALRHIFVPPLLSPRRIADHAPEAALHAGGEDLPGWLARAHAGQGPAIMALSGRPGSGKTTLTRWLALSLARLDMEARGWSFHGRLPIHIALREAPLEGMRGLDELVRWWAAEVIGLDPQAVVEWLDYRGAILILDGLDEVGRIEQRARVLGWVRQHRWTAGGEGGLRNLTLITARPTGFDDVIEPGSVDVARLWIAPFSEEQVREYVHRWFELPHLQGPESARKARSLLEVLTGARASEPLRVLARRPAYLTVLCAIHYSRGELPHTRAALYEQIVASYIHALDAERGLKGQGRAPWDNPEDKLDVLSAVAFQAHMGGQSGRWAGDRQMVWTREELGQAVRRAIADKRLRLRRVEPRHAEALTDYFVARTGLLVETWAGRYQFAHLSFQEYLTACYLLNLAHTAGDVASFLVEHMLPRLGEEGWAEVTLLALAIDAQRGAVFGRVLARLEPTDPYHVRFLGKVLAGEELPLSDEERGAWLLAWLCRAADPRLELDRVPVCQLERNAPLLEGHAAAAAGAVVAGTPVLAALEARFPQPLAGDSISDAIFGPEPPQAEWLAARRWLVAPEGRWQVDPLAELALAAPLPGRPAPRPLPEGLDGALAAVAERVSLVRASTARDRAAAATVWWWVLDGWLRAEDGALRALEDACGRATPLAALLELPGWIPERLVCAPELLGSRLVRWRARTARRVLAAERAFRAAALYTGVSEPEDLALWRRLVEARNPGRSPLKDRPGRRLVESVSRPGRPFADWRRVEVAARDYVTFGQRESGELPPPPPGLSIEPLIALRSDRADSTWRARWGCAVSSLYFLGEIARLKLLHEQPLSRQRAVALRERLADPERRYAGLSAGARRVAETEWRRLSSTPLAPLGLLERALASRWRSLPVDRVSLDEQLPALLRALEG